MVTRILTAILISDGAGVSTRSEPDASGRHPNGRLEIDMSNEKDRRPGWWERAGRLLDEFGQWVKRRCAVPFRRFVKWLVRVVETAVETVVAVAKTSAEAVARNQTVKTIAGERRRLPTSQTGRYTCGSGTNACDCC